VLLVRGIEDQKKSAALMADLSRAVYAWGQTGVRPGSDLVAKTDTRSSR
jgi:hypothetical protein